MKEELTAGLSEGQIAELVQDHQIDAGELIGEPPGAPFAEFGLQPVDEIDGAEEPDAASVIDRVRADRGDQMRFAGTGRSRVIMPVPIVTTARSTIGITLFAVKLSSSRRGRGMAAPST